MFTMHMIFVNSVHFDHICSATRVHSWGSRLPTVRSALFQAAVVIIGSTPPTVLRASVADGSREAPRGAVSNSNPTMPGVHEAVADDTGRGAVRPAH